MGGDELKREDRMTTTDFDKIIWRDALTFVDFFATWCGPCQMMHPAIDKFQREMNGRVDVYKVDIDDRGMLDAFTPTVPNSYGTLICLAISSTVKCLV